MARNDANTTESEHQEASAKCKALRQQRVTCFQEVDDALPNEKKPLQEKLAKIDKDLEKLRTEVGKKAEAWQRAQEEVDTISDQAEEMASKHTELSEKLDETRHIARQ